MWDILFPPRCLICNKNGKWVCRLCENAMTYSTQFVEIGNSPQIQAFGMFEYSGNAKRLLHLYKYNRLTVVADTLKRVIRQYFARDPFRFVQKLLLMGIGERKRFEFGDEIETSSRVVRQGLFFREQDRMYNKIVRNTRGIAVPVPIGAKHYKERGFWQVDELFSGIAFDRYAMQYIPHMVGVRDTKTHQSKRNARQRLGKQDKHFFITNTGKEMFKSLVKQNVKHVIFLLVDDVISTGTTVFYLAKTLKDMAKQYGIITEFRAIAYMFNKRKI